MAKIQGIKELKKRLKEVKKLDRKKIAGWISPAEIRRLPPVGFPEVARELRKGREPKLMPYPEFKKKWRFREVPEFSIPEYQIRELYEDYKRWFKFKGRPEMFLPYREKLA